MIRKVGLMAAGIAVGLVITGVLLEQERRQETASSDVNAEKKNGLFCGSPFYYSFHDLIK